MNDDKDDSNDNQYGGGCIQRCQHTKCAREGFFPRRSDATHVQCDPMQVMSIRSGVANGGYEYQAPERAKPGAKI